MINQQDWRAQTKVESNHPPTDILVAWNERFHATSPQELIAWAAQSWEQDVVLTCSFGGTAGMVLLDMVMTVAPGIPIRYIDTGLLFPETYRLIDQVQSRYGLELQPVLPSQTVSEQARQEGDRLWERNPDRCCQLRKVAPLAATLNSYDAWITGVRRDGGTTRAQTPLLEWSNKYNLVKLNPLAYWDERSVWRYIHDHSVPYNTLLDQGYRSLGCLTCTRLPTNDDPRSGRWAGFNKSECGLHVEPA